MFVNSSKINIERTTIREETCVIRKGKKPAKPGADPNGKRCQHEWYLKAKHYKEVPTRALIEAVIEVVVGNIARLFMSHHHVKYRLWVEEAEDGKQKLIVASQLPEHYHLLGSCYANLGWLLGSPTPVAPYLWAPIHLFSYFVCDIDFHSGNALLVFDPRTQCYRPLRIDYGMACYSRYYHQYLYADSGQGFYHQRYPIDYYELYPITKEGVEGLPIYVGDMPANSHFPALTFYRPPKDRPGVIQQFFYPYDNAQVASAFSHERRIYHYNEILSQYSEWSGWSKFERPLLRDYTHLLLSDRQYPLEKWYFAFKFLVLKSYIGNVADFVLQDIVTVLTEDSAAAVNNMRQSVVGYLTERLKQLHEVLKTSAVFKACLQQNAYSWKYRVMTEFTNYCQAEKERLGSTTAMVGSVGYQADRVVASFK